MNHFFQSGTMEALVTDNSLVNAANEAIKIASHELKLAHEQASHAYKEKCFVQEQIAVHNSTGDQVMLGYAVSFLPALTAAHVLAQHNLDLCYIKQKMAVNARDQLVQHCHPEKLRALIREQSALKWKLSAIANCQEF
jgi:hypothetical protein